MSSMPQESFSVLEILDRGKKALDDLEVDLALKFFERALELDPLHREAVDLVARSALEIGNLEKAAEALLKSIELSPEGDWWRYLSLAEMMEGEMALKYYERGAELLEADLEKPGSSEKEIKSRLSSVYCSMVELYCSDCCDLPDAEQSCEELLSRAKDLDPENAEVYVALANLRVIQGKMEEANSVLDCYMKVWEKSIPRDERDDAEEQNLNVPEEEELLVIGYNTRTNSSKLLLELGRAQDAAMILEQLLAEDDRFIEIWYLTGVAYSAFEVESAKLYLEKAMQMLEKNPDPEIASCIQEALGRLVVSEGNTQTEEGTMDVDK